MEVENNDWSSKAHEYHFKSRQVELLASRHHTTIWTFISPVHIHIYDISISMFILYMHHDQATKVDLAPS